MLINKIYYTLVLLTFALYCNLYDTKLNQLISIYKFYDMENLVLIKADELHQIIESSVKKALLDHDQSKAKQEHPKLYTINQVAHRLHMAHASITKLVKSGVIKTTKTGRISEEALNEFLATQ